MVLYNNLKDFATRALRGFSNRLRFLKREVCTVLQRLKGVAYLSSILLDLKVNLSDDIGIIGNPG